MMCRTDYYRVWLAVPLVLPLLAVAGIAALSPEALHRQWPMILLFFLLGWLPYLGIASGYYRVSRALSPDALRASLMAAPVRMLGWVAGIVALGAIPFGPFALMVVLPIAAAAALVIGYTFVGLAVGLEWALRRSGRVPTDW